MLTDLLAGSPVPLFDKVCFRNSFGARKSRRAKLRDRGGGGGLKGMSARMVRVSDRVSTLALSLTVKRGRGELG